MLMDLKRYRMRYERVLRSFPITDMYGYDLNKLLSSFLTVGR